MHPVIAHRRRWLAAHEVAELMSACWVWHPLTVVIKGLLARVAHKARRLTVHEVSELVKAVRIWPPLTFWVVRASSMTAISA